MTNSPALEAAIAKTGISKKSLAKQLALSEMGLFRKINLSQNLRLAKLSLCKKFCHLLIVKETLFFLHPMLIINQHYQ
ncbi:MAG: hypothetical protein IKK97_04525 [Phascolarctobacterium sp.]|nr:hypothetical protein [Phascolarctobacterium sp.]